MHSPPFANYAITVDLAANRLWIETPSSLAIRTKSARELRARIAREAAGAALDLASSTPSSSWTTS